MPSAPVARRRSSRPARPARPPRHNARRKPTGADLAKVAGMSDDAVKRATGKDWAGWCAVLDKAGAAAWSHAEIARFLHDARACPDWWSQMVTVGYERIRGLRVKHQVAGGFRASASRTIAAPAGAAFDAWNDGSARRRWLGDHSASIRTATRPRSLRITWHDGTDVQVMITSKAAAKCQVAVEHGKLASARSVTHSKDLWRGALDRLQAMLERSR